MSFLAKSKGELLTNEPFARVFVQGIAKKKGGETLFLIGKTFSLILCVVFLVEVVTSLISRGHLES
ncbi:MAG TPA: hypothetical protein DC054_14450 [Blastocatellia bacterium]|nr:hypothetical protein [Blastocatellia bacterium]